LQKSNYKGEAREVFAKTIHVLANLTGSGFHSAVSSVYKNQPKTIRLGIKNHPAN